VELTVPVYMTPKEVRQDLCRLELMGSILLRLLY
jgi:hypothetical protein